jgi:hypothetical protein
LPFGKLACVTKRKLTTNTFFEHEDTKAQSHYCQGKYREATIAAGINIVYPPKTFRAKKCLIEEAFLKSNISYIYFNHQVYTCGLKPLTSKS